MILIDANVWIYTLDASTPEHAAASRAVRRAVDKDEILMPSLVGIEVTHYMHRRFGDQAEVALADWFAQPCRHRLFGPHDVRAASWLMTMQRAQGIGGRDAALLHHASQDRALLVTNDAELLAAARDRGIATWNPIIEDDTAFEAWKPRPQKVVRERAKGARDRWLASRHGGQGGRRKVARG